MKLNVLVVVAVSGVPLALSAHTLLTQGTEVQQCYSVQQYAEVSPAECIERAANTMNQKLKHAIDEKLSHIDGHAAYNEPFSMEQGGEAIKTVYAKTLRESQALWEQARDSLCEAVATPSGNATDSYNAGYMQCIINLDRRRLEELAMMPPAS